ncbi:MULTISPECIES: sigma-70 family RNA polymerase sigma factor [unclassified Microcoleus]|uniref:sigma-70 family RNA polymerase sigma factor n=1 Tax=unclassified Microcoleus TaxID=2642155 RepID=UPI002FD51816
MQARHLQLEDIHDVNDPLSVAVIFEKLGYDACCEPIDVKDLDLSSASANSIREAYLIANQGNSDLQIFLFELQPNSWSSDTAAANRMHSIAKSLCKRPSFFLLVATCNYKQLLLVSPIKKFNIKMELNVRISKVFIDLKTPNFYTLNLLEKIAAKSLDLHTLYHVQHRTLAEALPLKEAVRDNDSIRWYLNHIGKIALIDRQEEIVFSRKIQHWLELDKSKRKLKTQLKCDPTDWEWADSCSLQISELYDIITAGKFAFHRLVNANLRLVVSIAKKYVNRGMDFLDLIQEGNKGLMIAAKKFDPNKGYKFSTYAIWWIKQSITRGLYNHSRIIRLPVHIYERISLVKKNTHILLQELGRNPSVEEIANRTNITIEKLQDITKVVQLPISLETLISNEDNSRLGDLIKFEGEIPNDYLERLWSLQNLDNILMALSEKDQSILRLRYGLDDGQAKTLEEIGQFFGLTRERIRQIEYKARQKFKKEYLLLNGDCTNTSQTALPSSNRLNTLRENFDCQLSNEQINALEITKPIFSEKSTTQHFHEINGQRKLFPDNNELLKKHIFLLISGGVYTKPEHIVYIVWGIAKHATPDLYAIAETELFQLMKW